MQVSSGGRTIIYDRPVSPAEFGAGYESTATDVDVNLCLPTGVSFSADSGFLSEGAGVSSAQTVTSGVAVNGSWLLTMAEFAQAAYFRQTWEPRSETSADTNDFSPNAEAALRALESKGCRPIDNFSLGISDPAMSSGDFLSGLKEGYYTNENGAALVMVSSDALVLSFRGTNDSPALIAGSPDRDDWNNMSEHYDHFSELIDAVDDYVADNSNITQVFVAGHSLGAGMVEAFLGNHPNGGQDGASDVTYQGAAFASPGYWTFPNFRPEDTDRLTTFTNEDDIIRTAASLRDNFGDQNDIFFGSGDDFGLVGGSVEEHSMELYLALIQEFQNVGVPDDLLIAGQGDVNLDRVVTQYTLVNGSSQTYTIAAGDEQLFGSQLHPQLFVAGAGSDIVRAYGGDDYIFGGSGQNTLYGNGGDDEIYGGVDRDVIHAGSGEDVVYAGDGIDSVRGGSGEDELNGQSGIDYLFGQSDDDILSGGDDGDYLFGGSGEDILRGNNGNDEPFGEADRDMLWGGQGNDLIRGGGGNDSMRGEDGNDWIYGDDQTDYLFGQGDNDRLFGGYGQDILWGGDGRDYLYGQFNADILDGDSGIDFLYGGLSRDTFVFSEGNDVDVIRDWEDDYDVVDISDFSEAQLNAAIADQKEVDGQVRLDFGGGDIIVFVGASEGDITSADFI